VALLVSRCQTPLLQFQYKEKQAVKKSAKERSNQMLTQNTFDKIVYEYQHGGVKNNHPELTTYERKKLLKYLFSLPTYCSCCVKG
jgi:tRNA A37 N6-isopentenylltransferase MiaA